MTQPIQTLTGTQVPLDAAYIANLAAQNNLTARGQDISLRGQDVQMVGLLAQFDQAGQVALQEYYNNVAAFGLDKARSIYEQRLAKATIDLQAAQAGGQQRLGAGQLKLDTLKALSDRSGPQNWVGYSYMLDKLAQPTGQRVDPFSWADSVVDPRFNDPGYNWSGNVGDESLFSGLEGPGMAPGLGSSPASLGGMSNLRTVEPWQYRLQAGAGGGGGAGQATSSLFSGGGAPYTGAGTAMSPGISPVRNVSGTPLETVFSGVRNQDVADMRSGDKRFITTGIGGPSRVSDYVGYNVYRDPSTQYGANDEIAGGTPIWLTKLSRGTRGPITDRIAIVGEDASAEDLGENGELLLNYTGAPLDIVNNDDAKEMLEAMEGEVTMGREMDHMGAMKRAVKGYALGSFGAPPVGNMTTAAPGPTLSADAPLPPMSRPMPAPGRTMGRPPVRRGPGPMPAPGRRPMPRPPQRREPIDPWGGRYPGGLPGEPAPSPKPLPTAYPTPAPDGPIGRPGGPPVEWRTQPSAPSPYPAWLNRLGGIRSYAGGTFEWIGEQTTPDGTRHVQNPDGSWSGYWADGREAYRPVGNDPAYAWARNRGPAPAGVRWAGTSGGMSLTDPSSPAYQGNVSGGQAAGGLAGAAATAGVQGATGAGVTTYQPNGEEGSWGMPETPDYLTYSPEVIGNQPWLKALLRGQRGGGTFGSLGATLDNPRLGVVNAPSNINVQGFRDMDASQRKAVGSLYSQGLGMDFDDILGRAEKAAPVGRTTGRKRYGY